MAALDVLLQKINSGEILHSSTFDNFDIDEALDSRELPEFDEEWMRVFNRIEHLLEANPLSQVYESLIDEIREASFKKAFEFSQDSEISAFVSDDFELICKAIALNFEDEWLNALLSSYVSGKFPTGNIK